VTDTQLPLGWKFSVWDRDGRPFEVDFSFSNIREIALNQRRSTVSNFHKVLDKVCDKLTEKRAEYFRRRDAVELH